MTTYEAELTEFEEVSEGGDTAKDIQYDDWLIPNGDPLNTVAAHLFEEMEASFPRPKKQRRDATQRRRDMVANIVANLALVHCHHPEGSRLKVSAGNLRTTRYDRSSFSRKAFMEVIEALDTLKYLHRERGVKGGLRTTIEPTDALSMFLPPTGSSLPLARLAGAETIILRATIGRNKPKALADYEDTPETHLLRAEMETINAALSRATITLDGQAQPPVHMTRMFQVDSMESPRTFDQHGRLYGGFWEHLPKDQRHLIQIDGQRVAELDFSGMFVQLAYAEAGLPPPESDPYEGLEGLSREAAKTAMSVLLSRSGPMKRVPSDLRRLLPDPRMTGPVVAEALASRHPGIAHLFGKGTGLKLMHTESCIAVLTLLRLIDRGIPALPIHDAMLVAENRADECKATMEIAALDVLGRRLPVQRKDNFPPMD